jgi:hypothetical protein
MDCRLSFGTYLIGQYAPTPEKPARNLTCRDYFPQKVHKTSAFLPFLAQNYELISGPLTMYYMHPKQNHLNCRTVLSW